MQTRMFYVDDSGASDTGFAVFSWIECDITAWRTCLRAWLDLRKQLFTDHGIPPDHELHASEFISGRGRPSHDQAWNLSKANRVHVALSALETIGRCTELRLGTVYRRFAKARELGSARAGLYHALVDRLDSRLAAANELGMVFVDGDGTDPAYAVAHRALTLHARHIVEDPVFRISARSQWVQMADLVAYVAYQSLVRDPRRQFLWSWYARYLRYSDVAGGPQEL